MWFKGPELGFCFLFIASCFTNKYVLSQLKFTYPTIFQGWQTLVGSLLLLTAWKLGRVEIRKNALWSAKVSWIPGALLFVGNIYAGSRALSKLPIPFFLLLQNTSEVIVTTCLKIARKEKLSWLKFLGMFMFPLSAVILAYNDSQFDPGGYIWAMIHSLCVGIYKVFQKLTKSYSLTELEEQFLNYLYSVLTLILLAQLSGDVYGALEFPFLNAYRFRSSCCASAILGVSLKLASVNVKSNLSSEQYGTLRLVTKYATILHKLRKAKKMSSYCVVGRVPVSLKLLHSSGLAWKRNMSGMNAPQEIRHVQKDPHTNFHIEIILSRYITV
ncbi:UDP-N-acetylglucosamine transporter TMEM241 homolog isoform X3 [Chiloscyllium punctatum]|uniref:UDP-N-acetylglucosamine transporter TMEM241 homolog isoform X3 n=1 Tax=Chiloscyllium punctatum TaxID=137246 RepID=UPI003B6419DD